MEIKVNFSGKALDYTEEEIATVVEAMRHAEPYTQGRYLAEFEQKFSNYIGASNCFAVNNGTSGLEIIAQLCRFQPGDEVVIPSHTFTASAYPFVKKGATPVWADIDLDTRVVSAKTIEKVLTPKTKAIVVVHLYGYVADMPAIMDLARSRGILVIEDAAQSIGAEVDGRKAGSFGDFAMFSFHSHKNLTTLGEGGMVIIKDDRLAKLVPMLRHNGHCPFSGDRPDYWVPAMGNVDLPELDGDMLMPNNFCIGEIECALGAKQLDRIDTINTEKRERAIRFIDALADFPELVFHRVSTVRHNYHLLAARLSSGRRDDFIRMMFHDKGVKCVVQYCPLNRYDFYVRLGFDKACCPNADTFYDTMISFPFQHWLSEDDFSYMLTATRDVLSALRK